MHGQNSFALLSYKPLYSMNTFVRFTDIVW